MDARWRLFLWALLAAFAAASKAQEALPSLDARPVSLCTPASACERIGDLQVLGVLELPRRTVRGLALAGLSGLAWDEDETILYAVSDQGQLFGLRPVFRDNRLVDVTARSAAELIDSKTNKATKWRRSDSEGLDILNARNGRKGDTELLISFEGDPHIARYRPDGHFIAEVPLAKDLRDIKNYRYNRMLESVCNHPREGILTIPEEPLLRDHDSARLYRTDGKSWRIPANRGGIVALECLADGDILIMNRELLAISLRWVITLRRLSLPPDTPADALLSAKTLAVLDSVNDLQIDNFEGLAQHRGNRFFMVSDNNNVFFQRTLLMYFEILPSSP